MLKSIDEILLVDRCTDFEINEDFDEFGMNRLRMAAESAKKMNASGIVESITSSINGHAGGTPQFDDITLVVMKRLEQ